MTSPHAHDHSAIGHAHGRHVHPPAGDAIGTRRALVIALVLTAGFSLVEAVGGWLSGSLALLSDAGHMITDAAALGLALFADAVARRPPSKRASYGYGRAEVLAAFVNAIAMLAVVAAITIEAVRRLLAPEPVAGGVVVGIALAGLIVNLVAAWVLSRASGSLNARGALLHVMGDLLGSLAALVAGGVILATGWLPIDPLLSLVVALLILRSTWQLLKHSTGVLMEGVPTHLDYDAIGRSLAELPGVTDAHDLHVWNMTTEGVALSAHLSLARADDWLATLAQAKRMLQADFGIRHATLQPTWPVAPVARDERRVIPVVPAGESGAGSDFDE
ncbi:MAG: cation transporter [Burkholderiales bacterium]|nr:cation transporter [Burkholderiales bacterium]